TFFVFCIYTLFHFIAISEPTWENMSRLYIGSLIGYPIGRVLSTREKQYVMTFFLVFSFLLLTGMFINFGKVLTSSAALKLNRVGIGEGVGILFVYTMLSALISSVSIVRRSLMFIVGGIIQFLNLVTLTGRGSVIFSTATVAMFYLVYNKKSNMVWKKILLLAIFAVFMYFTLIYLSTIFPWVSRFNLRNMLSDPSVVGNHIFVGRFDLYKESLKVFSQRVFFGAGYGEVYSHNIFLETMSCFGIVGLILFCAFLASFFAEAIKSDMVRKRDVLCNIAFAIFVFLLLYRQTSFSWANHKALMFFAGAVVSEISRSNS
ncbi:MAG TPA: hypothetical protein DDY74_05900, partial [Pseudothermotoga sp.]|nr:hypothetical protein [Pseudothermotoga sp.]